MELKQNKSISFIEFYRFQKTDAEVVGFKYHNYNFYIDDPSSFEIQKYEKEELKDEIIEKYSVIKLVKVTKDFLEENYFNVSYEDYKSNNFKIYTVINGAI